MFYVPTDYLDYNYLVDYDSNYLVLSNRSRILGESGDSDSIPCIIQYLTPSINTIETTYSSYDSRSFSDVSNFMSDSIFDRADFPQIFICNFIIILIFAFIINQLSKLCVRGGIFGNS